MSEPVEVPEEAVGMASAAYYRAVGMVLDEATRLEQIGVLGAMRAALVAARPYLVPGREQIAEAMHNHWSDTHLWRQGCREDLCISIFLDRASVILALLNGEIKKA